MASPFQGERRRKLSQRVGKVVGSVAGGQEFQTFLRDSGFGVNFEDAQVFAETLKREDRALGALLDTAIGKSTNEHE